MPRLLRFSPFLVALGLLCCFIFRASVVHAQQATGTPVPSAMATPLPASAKASPAKASASSNTNPAPLPEFHSTLLQKAQSLFGLFAFMGICFVIGQLYNRKLKPMLRTVIWGIILQFVFALLVLKTPFVFQAVNAGVDALLNFASQGSYFLFGNLTKTNVPVGHPLGPPDFGPIPSPTAYANTGAYFAFTVLPTIIFFSALSTLLYFLGVLQPVVKGLSWIMQRTMGTSGSETLSGVANIFLGQTEAPLFVRPFIARCTRSELMAIMTGGFSNIASGVLAAYVALLYTFNHDIAGHLLATSIISAPASLVIAKLLLPESEESETMGSTKLHIVKTDANVIDAAARGAIEGLELALNVGAMLLVFIALVAMVNALLGIVGSYISVPNLSLQLILGYMLAPFAWLLGVPWEYCAKVGSLLGIKTAVNEFVAYTELAKQMGANRAYLDPRSFLLATYALCGFANFSSIAIQIGGIAAMAPERRHDLSKLGMISMFGGAVATCMTACVVGILL